MAASDPGAGMSGPYSMVTNSGTPNFLQSTHASHMNGGRTGFGPPGQPLHQLNPFAFLDSGIGMVPSGGPPASQQSLLLNSAGALHAQGFSNVIAAAAAAASSSLYVNRNVTPSGHDLVQHMTGALTPQGSQPQHLGQELSWLRPQQQHHPFLIPSSQMSSTRDMSGQGGGRITTLPPQILPHGLNPATFGSIPNYCSDNRNRSSTAAKLVPGPGLGGPMSQLPPQQMGKQNLNCDEFNNSNRITQHPSQNHSYSPAHQNQFILQQEQQARVLQQTQQQSQQLHQQLRPTNLQFVWPPPNVRSDTLSVPHVIPFPLSSPHSNRMFSGISSQIRPPSLITNGSLAKNRISQLNTNQFSGLVNTSRQGGGHKRPRQFTATRPGDNTNSRIQDPIDYGIGWSSSGNGRQSLETGASLQLKQARDFPILQRRLVSRSSSAQTLSVDSIKKSPIGTSSEMPFFHLLVTTVLNKEIERSMQQQFKLTIEEDSQHPCVNTLVPLKSVTPILPSNKINNNSLPLLTNPINEDCLLNIIEPTQEENVNSLSHLLPTVQDIHATDIQQRSAKGSKSPGGSSKSPVTASSVEDSPVGGLEDDEIDTGDIQQQDKIGLTIPLETLQNDKISVNNNNQDNNDTIISNIDINHSIDQPNKEISSILPICIKPQFTTTPCHFATFGTVVPDISNQDTSSMSSSSGYSTTYIGFPKPSTVSSAALSLLTIILTFLDGANLSKCESLNKSARYIVRVQVPVFWKKACRTEEEDWAGLFITPIPPTSMISSSSSLFGEFYKLHWLKRQGALQHVGFKERQIEYDYKRMLEADINVLMEDNKSDESRHILTIKQDLLNQTRKLSQIQSELKLFARNTHKVLRSIRALQLAYPEKSDEYQFVSNLLRQPWATAELSVHRRSENHRHKVSCNLENVQSTPL